MITSLIKKGLRYPANTLEALGYEYLHARYADYDIYGKQDERLLIFNHDDGSRQLCFRYVVPLSERLQDNLEAKFNELVYGGHPKESYNSKQPSCGRCRP
jgi:hypothetical protein